MKCFFSLYQIFEDAIYGYTIILVPDHLDSLLLKKIELAKNIVKFFFGHIQKHIYITPLSYFSKIIDAKHIDNESRWMTRPFS